MKLYIADDQWHVWDVRDKPLKGAREVEVPPELAKRWLKATEEFERMTKEVTAHLKSLEATRVLWQADAGGTKH